MERLSIEGKNVRRGTSRSPSENGDQVGRNPLGHSGRPASSFRLRLAMKGIIFKHFESFIVDSFGDEVFEEVLEETQLQTAGPFVGPNTYPDADLFALVGTAIGKLGIPLNDALHAFGTYLFSHLAAAAPVFVESAPDLRSFLLTIHSVIHVEVRKLFPGAETPHFSYEEPAEDQLVMHCTSARNLCPLVRGLLEGAAKSFGETIVCTETACVHDGADRCTFELEFLGAMEKAA